MLIHISQVQGAFLPSPSLYINGVVLYFIVACMLSEWSQWEVCSVTCGGGTRVRTRTELVSPKHNGAVCSGSTDDEQTCNNQHCPGKYCNRCDSQYVGLTAEGS